MEDDSRDTKTLAHVRRKSGHVDQAVQKDADKV